ncbi:DUF3331 domain-containing protein [Burkholderia sp. BCC1977]|uniref:DUF3331 domain-containing protein n=1 Tax=Burkholderia sp. BCC1977 TaxID=2817440 RepID=UPI002ABE33D9|nr:DUF3331 domain-containing protein [Burkholderia sp. BCC1977]
MPDIMESLICEEDLSCVASTCGAPDAMPSPGDAAAHPVATLAALMAFGRAPRRTAAALSPLRPQLFVTVLEAGDDGLLVRWVESGRCHYGEQRWRLRVALVPGRCAISGRLIEPGEPVFRPVRRPVPANADEMICPASVPQVAGAVPDAGHDATDPAEVTG